MESGKRSLTARTWGTCKRTSNQRRPRPSLQNDQKPNLARPSMRPFIQTPQASGLGAGLSAMGKVWLLASAYS